jgi:hypothetical protein
MADEGKPPAGRGSGSGRGAPRKVGETGFSVPYFHDGQSHMQQKHASSTAAARPSSVCCQVVAAVPAVYRITSSDNQSNTAAKSVNPKCSYHLQQPKQQAHSPHIPAAGVLLSLSQHTHPLCSSRASLLNNIATAYHKRHSSYHLQLPEQQQQRTCRSPPQVASSWCAEHLLLSTINSASVTAAACTSPEAVITYSSTSSRNRQCSSKRLSTSSHCASHPLRLHASSTTRPMNPSRTSPKSSSTHPTHCCQRMRPVLTITPQPDTPTQKTHALLLLLLLPLLLLLTPHPSGQVCAHRPQPAAP